MSDMVQLPNSGNLISLRVTCWSQLYVPLMVVVLFGGCFVGTTPYGKHPLLIMIDVPPESRSAIRLLCGIEFSIFLVVILTTGHKSNHGRLCSVVATSASTRACTVDVAVAAESSASSPTGFDSHL